MYYCSMYNSPREVEPRRRPLRQTGRGRNSCPTRRQHRWMLGQPRRWSRRRDQRRRTRSSSQGKELPSRLPERRCRKRGPYSRSLDKVERRRWNPKMCSTFHHTFHWASDENEPSKIQPTVPHKNNRDERSVLHVHPHSCLRGTSECSQLMTTKHRWRTKSKLNWSRLKLITRSN